MTSALIAIRCSSGVPKPAERKRKFSSSPEKPRLRTTSSWLRKAAVQQGLEMAEVLHPVGQRVADDGDRVALFQCQPGRVGRCGNGASQK